MKKLLGNCGVDSGQLIVVDPCYLSDWKDGKHDKLDNHYGKCCKASLGKDSGDEVLVSGIAGTGVCLATGYGDGNYPVYAEYNKDKRIKKIIIEFE